MVAADYKSSIKSSEQGYMAQRVTWQGKLHIQIIYMPTSMTASCCRQGSDLVLYNAQHPFVKFPTFCSCNSILTSIVIRRNPLGSTRMRRFTFNFPHWYSFLRAIVIVRTRVKLTG